MAGKISIALKIALLNRRVANRRRKIVKSPRLRHLRVKGTELAGDGISLLTR
jgi:hypothetical protein